MTRFWPDGLAIEVDAANGAPPGHFIWEGRRHQVTYIARRWRVDVGWWRNRIWRAYYKLSTDTGLLIILFQDLTTGDWYLQRLYD